MAKKPTEKQLYKLKNEWLGQFFEEVKPKEFYRAVFPEGSFERAGHFEDGTSKQADLEGGWYEFEKDYFGSVFFEGKTIPCISLKGQKVFHSGYELRDKDKHDISILESLSK